ncbi:hypothetical protein CKF54_02480 [Psittacicella hinzii]|uniref:Uncharacterized protein n=1 Tax=Psittacicella hinzii TaxID=2028575 RepID=A0A3A1Y7L7_9GAMM|nr:hypothetical protein [Psittacicella hinzii]RIY33605.1 hypothetical protein CKF54_02480 [Psittacicella hinzii]
MPILISLVIVIAIIAGLFIIYFQKLKPAKDDFRGSSLQAVYTLTTQFADKKYLDASFIEIYTKAITNNYKISDAVLTHHIALLQQCIVSSNLARNIIHDSLAMLTTEDKAQVIAKAISLTVQIEGKANIFTKQLKVVGSRASQNYKEILTSLNLTNADVKQALMLLNATTAQERT